MKAFFVVLVIGLCSAHVSLACNFYVEKPEDAFQQVVHSNKFGKSCVIIFPEAAFRRLNLTISFAQIQNVSDSCSTSFIKVYEVNEDEASQNSRQKRYHACSPKEGGSFSLSSEKRTVIMTLQTQFTLKFHYEDMSEISGSYFEKLRTDYRSKESCLQDQMVPCYSSRKCLHNNDSSPLCNATNFLCIKPEQKCNGVFDCEGDDTSDEKRCSFPMWRILMILISVVCSVGTVSFCSHTHYKALKLRNMVRYQGDVIKRKDIVKIKKILGE